MDEELPSTYQLELTPDKRRVFVTQLIEEDGDEDEVDDVKKYPIISENAGRLVELGFNTLQKTLLLKKEVEVERTNEELKLKKIECEERMLKCAELEKDLNNKKEQIEQRVEKFHRFVEENNAKRERAIVKFQAEHKGKLQKVDELEALKNNYAALVERNEDLRNKLQKNNVYEKYLLEVLDITQEGYLEMSDNMIHALMMRHNTLDIAHNSLNSGHLQRTEEYEEGNHQLSNLSLEQSQQIMVFSKEVSALQSQLEELTNKNARKEQDILESFSNYREETQTLSQIKLAIENLTSKCIGKRNPETVEGLSFLQKLDLIKGYIQDQEAIHVDILSSTTSKRNVGSSSSRSKASSNSERGTGGKRHDSAL